MNYISTTTNGKPQLNKDKAFVHLLNGDIPSYNNSILEILSEMDKKVRSENSSVSGGALNNAHGDWYEWLIAIQAWNFFLKNQNSDLAILLPNISTFDVALLYKKELSEFIEDLRHKVLNVAKVRLITSNPDFVIIDGELARNVLSDLSEISKFDCDTLTYLSNIYKNFVGKCEFNQIKGYISVKTSFRPDRRLQISHEGSLMKALYIHLQTRRWEINPPGLKYYAAAAKVGVSDKKALKTVATHSITTVSSTPQAAVDEVFQINSLQKADEMFERVLKH